MLLVNVTVRKPTGVLPRLVGPRGAF